MGTPKGRGKTAPWREHLRRAAEYLERHGLCQFTPFAEKTGEICMNEAIARGVAGVDTRARHWWLPSEAANALRDYLMPDRKGYNDDHAIGDLCRWNNAPGRTTAEGVAALKAAAEAR